MSNGEVIWDIAGNVWEFVKDDPDFYFGNDSYWVGIDANYGNACISPECSSPQGKPKAAFGPIGDYSYKVGGERGGIGYAYFAGNNLGGIIRGGTGLSSAISSNVVGVFTVFMHSDPGYTANTVGFRCVLGSGL